MFAIVPLAVGVRESTSAHDARPRDRPGRKPFADPYQVPDVNFGWSARDACYSYGSFVLDDDEALVITHRPPPCRFWNLVVWNQFMAGHDVTDARMLGQRPQRRAERRRLRHGRDLPWDDGHPNSLTTLDYPRGNLAFRWFLADEVPARPEVRLVKISDAPTTVD